jgi:tRNA(Ile)-lysidine synthase
VSELSDEFLFHIVGWPFVNARAAHVGVAVSGGGDSMALLALMQHWAKKHGTAISAVTVDHGLRPEAAAEAAMVAEFCASQGIDQDILRWDGWDGQGNLQAAARDARYRLMADWAKAKGVDAICLGHTRDDQAETFLMRLARKAGSDGLRGMPDRFERHGMRWVRPVLDVGRADLRAFLRRHEIEWVDDPSNEDEGFDRVKARRVLAALDPLGIDAAVLSAVAHNLDMENSLIRDVVCKDLQGQVAEFRGALAMEKAVFDRLHPEVLRRFLIRAIQWITGASYPPRVEAEVEMEVALRQGGTHTLAGVIGWVTKGRIWLAREYEPVRQMTGNPFDGRWQIDGPLEGREIRALGPEGLKQMPDWRDLGLPRRVFLPLPGVWQGDKLVAAPLAGKAIHHKATHLRPSFDNWLAQH